METTTKNRAPRGNPDSVKQESPTHTGHTPGPWTTDASEQVADVVLDSQRCLVARIANNGRSRKANARLIAAAPALLNSLRSIERSLEIRLTSKAADQPAWQILNEARKVLAPATGKDAV